MREVSEELRKINMLGWTMDKEQFIQESLCCPFTAISYHASQFLATRFPDRALLEGRETLFNIGEFAANGRCDVKQKTIVHNQVFTCWHGPQLYTRYGPEGLPLLNREVSQQVDDHLENGWLEVVWDGSIFDVLVMHWESPGFGGGISYHYWILAESMERARALFVEVCRWNAQVHEEVLVFDNGCWRKDAKLLQAIKSSTFDNLILRGSLKQELRQDIEQFFAAHSTYETYNIPWKRGILFVGPPGNGKTHAVRAILNATNQPCLYVKSFQTPQHMRANTGIGPVFERARQAAPCILVLEDLDSLLTPENRSYFLNELDGFAANVGIVTLATTNYPERLDPSILDRPSRFDRKYTFDLPERSERLAYIALWNETLQETLRISDATVHKLSEATEGFSFAYIKELFLSSMMRWVAHPQQGTMDQELISLVDVLRKQMMSKTTQAAEGEKG
jgi:AAA+ superfamily predicted ATPase